MLLIILLTLSVIAMATANTTFTRVVLIKDENAEKAMTSTMNVIILFTMSLATVIICIGCLLRRT